MVTADIRAFAKPGSRLDVVVSSMGDAKSLQGGVLIQTPLLGIDGKVYALAQGHFPSAASPRGTAARAGRPFRKNHPTVGTIVNGAIYPQDILATVVNDNHLELMLREPDFTSAARMAEAVNNSLPIPPSPWTPPRSRVKIPANWGADTAPEFIAQLEALEVTPDVPARIVINERTGTIVATARIHISSCAIAHGNVTISIVSNQDVSQPGSFSQTGTTTVTTRTDAKIKEDKGSMVALPELPTVEKVAAALNSLGVTPRDMMSMFEAMKRSRCLAGRLNPPVIWKSLTSKPLTSRWNNWPGTTRFPTGIKSAKSPGNLKPCSSVKSFKTRANPPSPPRRRRTASTSGFTMT